MKVTAYVDGSFNAATQVYGSGAVVFFEGKEEPYLISQAGDTPAFAKSRNVAGEVVAAALVMNGCRDLPNIEELTIYYDYNGIRCWYERTWKANSVVARTYLASVRDLGFKVTFKKVKAHSGDTFNDMADELAKKACGLA